MVRSRASQGWAQLLTAFPAVVPDPRGHTETVPSLYEAAGGDEGLLRLAEAWHVRVMADEVVEPCLQPRVPAPPHRAARRVLGGGPGRTRSLLGEVRDETSVVRMHSGNGEHQEMDQRAIACFDEALGDVGLDVDGPLGRRPARLLRVGDHDHHGPPHESADDVPEGLTISRWSGDGLQT